MSSSTDSSKPTDVLLEEWKEARSIVNSLDTLLSGLRKFGFSFITALLGADSILGQASGQASIVLSPVVKLGVMIATLALIIGLYATDRFYRMIQQAASTTAKAIEAIWKDKSTHVDGPTQTISDAYKLDYGWIFIDFLYILFGIANLLLGVFILLPNYGFIFWLFVVSFLVAAFGYKLHLIGSGGKTTRELWRIWFGRRAESKPDS